MLTCKHLTGTPIQNRLDELFPYFKFLRVKHTGSISVFRQNFCLKDSDVCNKRLHSMLAGMMVRRTHSDTVLGAPLIKLPKNTQETIKLKFNKVERHIYELVRMRCVKAINS
jgi:SNF2 family DNA or RNA helicase